MIVKLLVVPSFTIDEIVITKAIVLSKREDIGPRNCTVAVSILMYRNTEFYFNEKINTRGIIIRILKS